MQIKKRDGRVVPFNENKIIDAILSAFIEVDGTTSEYALIKAGNIADYIAEQISQADHVLDVEEIQDMVENGLMSTKRKDVAKSYINYRQKRTEERNKRNETYNLIREKLYAMNTVNSNANVDENSFGGRKGEVDSVIMKDIALNDLISEKAVYNHLNNRVYIHDLDAYAVGMHNCLSIPFDKILANGFFDGKQTDIRPASSVNTAFQLVAVVFQLQSLQQFGGVSATHLDWTMVPYVRKSFIKHYKDGLKYIYHMTQEEIDQFPFDLSLEITCGRYAQNEEAYQYALDMTERETYQAVEGMYHNLNTLQSRSGNQLPFSSINYGTCTLPEGRMVIKALLDNSIKGVGKLGLTPVFPCGIFQYWKGVNDKPGTPNYDMYQLALKSTAKRLYPNYANVDWSGNAGFDPEDPCTYFSTMGCRTANGLDINGFGQRKDGRGNICPVTIIMPTLAMEAVEAVKQENMGNMVPQSMNWQEEQRIEKFMDLLDEAIHDAKDILIERFDWICSQDPASAKFMWMNGTMEGYDPEVGPYSALKHGTIVVGQLGLAETLQILIGCDHTEERGMELAKRIEQLFKDRCAQFKEEEKLNFGVYYTPAESLCYTAMNKFKAKYGEIPNVSDREYFTNSMHVPVWKEMSPFDKIDIEAQLTGYSSAGCITYVELDGAVGDNLEALETIVNYAMDKDIPYFAINIPNDQCLDCGWTGDINEACPKCGGKHIQRLRRVTGYLTGNYTTAFNLGKQAEVRDRYRHSNRLVNWRH